MEQGNRMPSKSKAADFILFSRSRATGILISSSLYAPQSLFFLYGGHLPVSLILDQTWPLGSALGDLSKCSKVVTRIPNSKCLEDESDWLSLSQVPTIDPISLGCVYLMG